MNDINRNNARRGESAGPGNDGTSLVPAIVQDRYGNADAWTFGAVERPTVGPREVLIEARASAIDRGTWHLMTGTPYIARLAFGIRRPRQTVPGLDVAGRVVEVGAEVTRFSPGDDVFGIGRGSLATHVVARQDKLAHKPTSMSFAQAAATGVSGLTALQGLCDVGRLVADQRVLITGASGGVGSFAVQIAKATGADVTGVCSSAKADYVSGLGADRVIASSAFASVSLASEGNAPYDLIFDTVGTISLRRLRAMLTRTGTLVLVGDATGRFGGLDRNLKAVLWSPFVSQRLTAFLSRERHDDLERLAALAEEGRLVPSVERTYPLEAAAEAMRHLDAGLARGKLVITTIPDEH